MSSLGLSVVGGNRHDERSIVMEKLSHLTVKPRGQNDQIFKDFSLLRILDGGKQRPLTSEPGTDEVWNTHIVLQIDPHPDL